MSLRTRAPLTVRVFRNTAWRNGCLEWQGNSSHKGGYGLIGKGGTNGGMITVHKAAYVAAFGPIPDGMVVRHKCDNPICVRPMHLELGTHADNVRDKVERGRQVRGEAHHNSRLTESDVLDILRRRRAGERGVDLAAEYGVHPMTITRITTGRRWGYTHEILKEK